MKIALIAPVRNWAAPFSLLYIGTALQAQGHDVAIFEGFGWLHEDPGRAAIGRGRLGPLGSRRRLAREPEKHGERGEEKSGQSQVQGVGKGCFRETRRVDHELPVLSYERHPRLGPRASRASAGRVTCALLAARPAVVKLTARCREGGRCPEIRFLEAKADFGTAPRGPVGAGRLTAGGGGLTPSRKWYRIPPAQHMVVRGVTGTAR